MMNRSIRQLVEKRLADTGVLRLYKTEIIQTTVGELAQQSLGTQG
jgi:hypothetical protein